MKLRFMEQSEHKSAELNLTLDIKDVKGIIRADDLRRPPQNIGGLHKSRAHYKKR